MNAQFLNNRGEITLDASTKKHLKDSLSRIEGHIRGIKNMLSEKRCYTDVLFQLHAVKLAIKRTELRFIKEYFRRKELKSHKEKQQLKDMLQCLSKERVY